MSPSSDGCRHRVKRADRAERFAIPWIALETIARGGPATFPRPEEGPRGRVRDRQIAFRIMDRELTNFRISRNLAATSDEYAVG
jgi:hypothetical protein